MYSIDAKQFNICMVVIILPEGNAAFEPSLKIEMNLHHGDTIITLSTML